MIKKIFYYFIFNHFGWPILQSHNEEKYERPSVVIEIIRSDLSTVFTITTPRWVWNVDRAWEVMPVRVQACD